MADLTASMVLSTMFRGQMDKNEWYLKIFISNVPQNKLLRKCSTTYCCLKFHNSFEVADWPRLESVNSAKLGQTKNSRLDYSPLFTFDRHSLR